MRRPVTRQWWVQLVEQKRVLANTTQRLSALLPVTPDRLYLLGAVGSVLWPYGQKAASVWPSDRLSAALLRRLALLLMGMLLAGCAGRVIPPPAPAEPVEIYLLDHGRHASLVLPRREGGLVRYSYGEWAWYVEGRRHPLAGASALFWPTPSGLGRGVDEQAAGPQDLARLAPEGIQKRYTLQADAWRVAGLRRGLDAHFDQPGIETVRSEEFGLEFVPYPRAYWLTHQSNLTVARWLRRLGFTVRGIPWLSNWHIEAPPGGDDADGGK